MDSHNPCTEQIQSETGLENGHDTLPETEKYKLQGYLLKHSDNTFVRGLIHHSTIGKKRWFVYSFSTCKLYYYKSDKDPEPLGEIDIALSSLSYNSDPIKSGLFTIRSGGKNYILEAPSPQIRLYWLQNLQNARRDFNEHLNIANIKSSSSCIERPKSGLLKDCNPLPEPTPDPHHDLIAVMNRSMDSLSKNQDEELVSKPTRSHLNLPLAKFSIASSSLSKQDGQVLPSINSDSEICSPQTSITSASEGTHFDRLSQKFMASLKLRRHKPYRFSDSETQEELCKKCLQFQEDMIILSEEVCNQKEMADAYKEAIQTLHKDLGALQRENTTLEKLIDRSLTNEDMLAIFREKDRKIMELEDRQHKLKNSISTMTSNLRDSRIRNQHLEEKVSLLMKLLECDRNLTVDPSVKCSEPKSPEEGPFEDALSSLIPDVGSYISPRIETTNIGTQTTNLEYEDLIDLLEGYKCQNTFLNKEILEHNLILKCRSERERKLIDESSNWEAKFYQIQSKYLLLLNDLHSPKSNQHDSSVLSQLLQDVVDAQGTADLRIINRQGKAYDEFGFCMTPPTHDKDLLSQAEFLQKQSQTNALLAEKSLSCSTHWESQWESFLVGTNAKELPQHPELKYLIREGIPYQYKGKVWRLLIESHIGKYKSTLSSSYYQDILSRRYSTSALDPSAKQIELDLLRTLPNNRHYQSPYSDGIPKLRRLLLAYSRRNLSVGYCQGLNRLGAIALLFLNEEDAFWCLVYIVEFLMPADFYSRNLLGSQVDQRVLKDLMNEKLPRLSAHFDHHGLDITLFTFNWFLCIFVDAIPPSTYLYIWDSFLDEGSKVLFRFAIAIFKVCEEDILNKKDYTSISDYLRSMPDQVANLQKLKQVAFQWVNPLSMKYIRNKREYQKTIVEAELLEVEQVRKTYYLVKKETASEEIEDDDDKDSELCEESERAVEAKEDDGVSDGLHEQSAVSNSGKKKMYSIMKDEFPVFSSSIGNLLGSNTKEEKNGEYTSVKLVPRGQICDEDIDDEQFEVITVRRESPCDSEKGSEREVI